MIIEPRMRGFICLTAHPDGCAQNIKNQIDYVKSKGKIEGASELKEATVQLSATVGVPRDNPVAVQSVLVFTVMSAGAVIVGFVMSITVEIVKICEMVQEFASVTVTV